MTAEVEVAPADSDATGTGPTPPPGRTQLAWRQMPVLRALRRQVRADRPLRGFNVAAAMHVSVETAHLIVTIREAGARVLLYGSNPETVDPAALAELHRRAIKVHPQEIDPRALAAQLHEFEPGLLLDNAMLLGACSGDARLAAGLTGATVHSSNGTRLVRSLLQTGALPGLPVVSVAESTLKHAIETPAGTGQSTVHALVRATGVQLSGKRTVVVGYGTAGSGIARYLSGMRSRVTVVDTSAVACLRALNDGHDVDILDNALSYADVVIVATGTRKLLDSRHFDLLADGVLIGNIGHYPDAVDVHALRRTADKVTDLGGGVEEYRLGGRSVLLLGRGSQLNHVCGTGNSSETMDLTLAMHLLCLLQFVADDPGLLAGLQPVPDVIAEAVARLKLRALGHVV